MNNQREIKFRVWSKNEERMIPWEKIENGSENTLKENFDAMEKIGFILMQFTGLKDGTKWMELTAEEQLDWMENKSKNGTNDDWNGKKIYEGDIVKVCSISVEDYIGKIAFSNGAFWISGKKNSLVFIPLKVEVIGNIYENPELLK